jgi:hypothetical protein
MRGRRCNPSGRRVLPNAQRGEAAAAGLCHCTLLRPEAREAASHADPACLWRRPCACVAARRELDEEMLRAPAGALSTTIARPGGITWLVPRFIR